MPPTTPIRLLSTARPRDYDARTLAGFTDWVKEQHRSAGDVLEAHVNYRALSSDIPTAGGFAKPEPTLESIFITVANESPLRSVCTITSSPKVGADIAVINDTSQTGEMVAENVAMTDTADVSFELRSAKGHRFTSKIVAVPASLLQDARPEFSEKLLTTLLRRCYRVENTKCTTGTPAPRGLVHAATSVSAANAASLSLDDLINLKYSAAADHREQPGSRFMLHSDVYKELLKLSSDTKPQLFTRLADGSAAIDGTRVVFNNAMDSTFAATKRTALFANFAAVEIRDVGVVRLATLSETRADKDQVLFFAAMRSDISVLDAGAVRVLVH